MNRLISSLLLLSILLFEVREVAAETNSSPDFLSFDKEKKTIVTSSALKLESAKNKMIGSIDNGWSKITEWCEDHNVLNSLSLGVSLGTTGLGFEIKTPATKWVDVRMGVDWMPRFNVPLSFNLNTYSDGIPTGNFQNVAELLYDMTGIEMDETVHMKGWGNMLNFKLLADIFPVPSNRHWHITAGFFAGTSMIAKTYNEYEEKPTLVGLNIYNRAHEYFTTLESIYDVPLGGGAYMDPELVRKLRDRFNRYGRMGIHIGDFKDGTPYIMDPAPDGTISAKALVNHFKPYLGGGYQTDLDKEGKWSLGVDVGVLFWGGAPKILNHDYNTGRDINFTKDLINLNGKVKEYVDACKSIPVYPLVAVRISYNIL